MRVQQADWTAQSGWTTRPQDFELVPDLVLVFYDGAAGGVGDAMKDVRRSFPESHIVGCSTAGNISGTEVLDESLSITAAKFEATPVEVAHTCAQKGSHAAGAELARALSEREGLAHVFVLSEGIHVNGSELVAGLVESLPAGVAVTGGLSADGDRFVHTSVLRDGAPAEDAVCAVGFYGDRLRVGYGSLGGWDAFGPERLVTRAEGNVLYELDGRSALQLYKEYLGKHAAGLPATGLLFPLSVRTADQETAVVRTILAVDEDAESMTFAGDIPSGSYARLMKANFNRLLDGAEGAATTCRDALPGSDPTLAILISCVGRKLVLKQRVEDEVEAVREVLGDGPALTGFYSYGEISPFTPGAKCELHNQTMTITTISEV
jgi:hypothetical protein